MHAAAGQQLQQPDADEGQHDEHQAVLDGAVAHHIRVDRVDHREGQRVRHDLGPALLPGDPGRRVGGLADVGVACHAGQREAGEHIARRGRGELGDLPLRLEAAVVDPLGHRQEATAEAGMRPVRAQLHLGRGSGGHDAEVGHADQLDGHRQGQRLVQRLVRQHRMQAMRIAAVARPRAYRQGLGAPLERHRAQAARVADGDHHPRVLAAQPALVLGHRHQRAERGPARLQRDLARIPVHLEQAALALLLVQRAVDAEFGRYRRQHEVAPLGIPCLLLAGPADALPLLGAAALQHRPQQHLRSRLRQRHAGLGGALALLALVDQPADAHQHHQQQQRHAAQDQQLPPQRLALHSSSPCPRAIQGRRQSRQPR